MRKASKSGWQTIAFAYHGGDGVREESGVNWAKGLKGERNRRRLSQLERVALHVLPTAAKIGLGCNVMI
jgi:hypothetical protein